MTSVSGVFQRSCSDFQEGSAVFSKLIRKLNFNTVSVSAKRFSLFHNFQLEVFVLFVFVLIKAPFTGRI